MASYKKLYPDSNMVFSSVLRTKARTCKHPNRSTSLETGAIIFTILVQACLTRCRDYTAGWMTGKSELDSSQIQAFFSSSPCPYRLWGPLILLSNGYLGVFPLTIDVERGVKLTNHLRLVLKSRICRTIHPLVATLAFNYTLL
jgi:hypothetical protein